MRLKRAPIGWLLALALSLTACSALGADPAPSSAPTKATTAAPTPTKPSPKPKPAPPKRQAPLLSYDPRYCGVTNHAADGKASNVLLTIDDFPYQDGNVMVKVAEWAQRTDTMMEAFPITHEVNAYNKRHRTDLVARTRALGTYVSNHTYSHANLLEVSNKRVKQQVTGGIDSSYVRPPYGAYDKEVRKFIEQSEHARVCHWTIDTEDWRKLPNGKYPPVKTLVQRVHKQIAAIRPGEPVVILGHYQTNYPQALQAIRDEVVRAKLHVCEAPKEPTTSLVPYPIC